MGTASWIGGTFCERDGRSAGIGLLRWLDQKPRRECTHLFWRGALHRLDDNRHRPQLCAAIVDGLTFNGEIIRARTDSYRFAR